MAGKPPGCTRDLPHAPLAAPVFSNPWQLDRILEPGQPGSDGFRFIEHDARLGIFSCYEDIGVEPAQCEHDYMNRIRGMSSGMNEDQLRLLDGAMEELRIRFENSENDRLKYGFFGNIYGSYSSGDVSIEHVPFFKWMLMEFPQYNKALHEARKKKVCALWMTLWDQTGCAEM